MRKYVTVYLWLLVFVVIASARVESAERNVSFKNGAVELKGTMMVPASAGKHPAVVFLHGSGPATREGARGYAEEFAKLGLVSLFFDKRGCGESGGSWITSSLDDLANDALAAMALLEQQPEVDPSRVGIWGVSQAGWVAAAAISKSTRVAFLVMVTGGGATPRETELFAYGKAFDRAGLSDAEKAEGFGVINRYFDYLATGEGRAEIVALLEQSRNARWYSHAPLERILPSEGNRANWSWVATWDPAPSIRKMKFPVLLMFGSQDEYVPTDVAVKKWRDGLSAAGNKDVTLVVFPDAGHGIRMGEHEAAGRAPFADGYAELTLGWLWSHVVQPSR